MDVCLCVRVYKHTKRDDGIGRNLTPQEQGRLKALMPILKDEIEAGLEYAKDCGRFQSSSFGSLVVVSRH